MRSGSGSYTPAPQTGFFASLADAVGSFLTSPGFKAGVALTAGYLVAKHLDQSANRVPGIDPKK
jgi:hypothetical protein